MAAYNYLIYITPLDFYFFGGETTFGNREGQNYYAKSQMFPQQTTILWLLRYLGYNKIDIGDSFDASQANAIQKFGYIHRLSPVFLAHHTTKVDYYIPSPLGDDSGKAYAVKPADGDVQTWKNGSWKAAFEFPAFKAKDGWDQKLISNKITKPVPFKEVFNKMTKIGITKMKSGESRNDAFYKQDLFKLSSGWTFAVLAELGDEVKQLPSSIVAPFGAEKALFEVKFKSGIYDFDSFFPSSMWEHTKPANLTSYILLSDAFVEDSIYNLCDFGITDKRDFRHIRTPKSLTRIGPIMQDVKQGDTAQKEPNAMYKSGKYNLLSRGSVLFSSDKSFELKLMAEAFHQIGYNHYVKL